MKMLKVVLEEMGLKEVVKREWTYESYTIFKRWLKDEDG